MWGALDQCLSATAAGTCGGTAKLSPSIPGACLKPALSHPFPSPQDGGEGEHPGVWLALAFPGRKPCSGGPWPGSLTWKKGSLPCAVLVGSPQSLTPDKHLSPLSQPSKASLRLCSCRGTDCLSRPSLASLHLHGLPSQLHPRTKGWENPPVFQPSPSNPALTTNWLGLGFPDCAEERTTLSHLV